MSDIDRDQEEKENLEEESSEVDLEDEDEMCGDCGEPLEDCDCITGESE